MKTKIIDLVERAAWTFVQAFVGVIIVLPNPFFIDKIVLAAALAAGISAIKTFVITSALPYIKDVVNSKTK